MTNQTLFVTVAGSKLEQALVGCGIPQGPVLGPIIFLLYVEDIRDKADKMSSIYVDDLKLAQSVMSEQDVLKFQIDLDTLYKWGNTNNCVFNIFPTNCNRKKTEILRQTRHESVNQIYS